MNESSIEGKAGKSPLLILLLKTKSTPHDGYEEYFSAVNEKCAFEPVFVPVLAHRFHEQNVDLVKNLLIERRISRDEAASYGGMIFTSQRAVEAFAKVVGEGQGVLISRTNLFLTWY
jgi:uroporphyrinogen-III synthase